MMYWTMLAACTVGPGTVVTCARAGAEYDLSLIWALVFASTLAYTLQEGTARLTIVSGKSLGQCLQERYKNGAKIYDTALLCWVIAILVFFGNTLYECNNWAGGIDAVLSLPGLENTDLIRIFSCVAYAVVTLALLYWDKVRLNLSAVDPVSQGVRLKCVRLTAVEQKQHVTSLILSGGHAGDVPRSRHDVHDRTLLRSGLCHGAGLQKVSTNNQPTNILQSNHELRSSAQVKNRNVFRSETS